MPKLTKTSVEKEQRGTVQRFVWDTDLKGFGVKIFPSGAKSFVFQYRTPEGQSRRLTIGKLSDSLTVEQARKIATTIMLEVKRGADPQARKKARKEALTVNQVIDAYLLSDAFLSKADSTKATDMGRITRHIRPLLGHVIADTLTTDAVRKLVKDVTDGATAAKLKTRARGVARVEGGAGTAKKAFMLLRAICHWANGEGVPAGKNVAWAAIKMVQDGQRETIIESADVYARLFTTLQKMQDEKRIRDAVADAIRLLALTGARRSEIAGLCWAYVDLKNGQLVLPPQAHKTGHRSGKNKIIALPAIAQEIIARQPQGGPDDFVFRPAKGRGALSLSKPWRDVRKEAGLPADLGLHGLRHSVASHLAMNGATTAELMEQMGHRQATTVARYVHFAERARSTLAERAASVAVAGMTGMAGEVIQIRKVKK